MLTLDQFSVKNHLKPDAIVLVRGILYSLSRVTETKVYGRCIYRCDEEDSVFDIHQIESILVPVVQRTDPLEPQTMAFPGPQVDQCVS